MKKRIKKIAIVAGGTLDKSFVPQIRSADLVIGVDAGASWLLARGVVPAVAVGDFDSVTPAQLAKIKKEVKEVLVHNPEKDATDLELAVEYAIGVRPIEITIYGGIGTRMDHTWAAIQLLQTIESHNIYAQIVDNFNNINIVRHVVSLKPKIAFPYISIFSLTATSIVTLQGFRYNVNHHKFFANSALGVSNEIVGKIAKITTHSGKVLVIRSRD